MICSTNKLDKIANIVCSEVGIDLQLLKDTSKIKKRIFVQPRQLILAKQAMFTKYNYTDIGGYLFGKDHATVTHAIKTVKNLEETDKQFYATSKRINEVIESILYFNKVKLINKPEKMHV